MVTNPALWLLPGGVPSVACRYEETRGNLALFAVDYQALFVDTIGRVVQRVSKAAAAVIDSFGPAAAAKLTTARHVAAFRLPSNPIQLAFGLHTTHLLLSKACHACCE